MGVLLKQVAVEARTDELRTQLKNIVSAFLDHREVSAQEVVYRLLSLPMKQLSRAVVFVDTNVKKDIIAVLKGRDAIDQLDGDDTNVFQKSLVVRYRHRPEQLQTMCLAEFAASMKYTMMNYSEGSTNILKRYVFLKINWSLYIISSPIATPSIAAATSKSTYTTTSTSAVVSTSKLHAVVRDEQ